MFYVKWIYVLFLYFLHLFSLIFVQKVGFTDTIWILGKVKVSKSRNKILPKNERTNFVFWEKLADQKLLSRLTDL